MENHQEYGPDKEMESCENFIKRHVSQLSEHFDAVQIIASRLAPDGQTEYYSFGSGNYFTRVGAIHEWLRRQPTGGG